jgi:hypothetical protein
MWYIQPHPKQALFLKKTPGLFTGRQLSRLMGIHFTKAEVSGAGDGNTSCTAFKSISNLIFALKPYSTGTPSFLLLSIKLKLVFSL